MSSFVVTEPLPPLFNKLIFRLPEIEEKKPHHIQFLFNDIFPCFPTSQLFHLTRINEWMNKSLTTTFRFRNSGGLAKTAHFNMALMSCEGNAFHSAIFHYPLFFSFSHSMIILTRHFLMISNYQRRKISFSSLHLSPYSRNLSQNPFFSRVDIQTGRGLVQVWSNEPLLPMESH